jgi:hypothetical protein
MKLRTIEEIEQAFREMGLTEKAWGRGQTNETEVVAECSPLDQIFIRIETTSTPLESKIDAHLA